MPQALFFGCVKSLTLAVLVDELVQHEFAAQRTAHPVVDMPVLLPGLHVVAVVVPERRAQFAHAGVEQVGVFENLVVVVVLGGQAQRTRLDAHVDVLRHQDHLALRFPLLQVDDHADDLVVGLADRHAGRQVGADRFGLQEQSSSGRIGVVPLEGNAFGDGVFRAGDDLVEEAAGLACVARHF